MTNQRMTITEYLNYVGSSWAQGWLQRANADRAGVFVAHAYLKVCDKKLQDAYVFAQIMYWADIDPETRQPRMTHWHKGHLWIVKTTEEWAAELHLDKPDSIGGSLRRLAARNLIIKQRHKSPFHNAQPVNFVRPNWEVIGKTLYAVAASGSPQNSSSEHEKNGHSEGGNNAGSETPKNTSALYTENTTETSTENTTNNNPPAHERDVNPLPPTIAAALEGMPGAFLRFQAQNGEPNDYIDAFTEVYPDPSLRRSLKAHQIADALRVGGYTPDDVRRMAKTKQEDGRADYTFWYLSADLAGERAVSSSASDDTPADAQPESGWLELTPARIAEIEALEAQLMENLR